MLHKSVRLKRDHPLLGLKQGTRGAVVEVYEDESIVEVEFFNEDGSTISVETIGVWILDYEE